MRLFLGFETPAAVAELLAPICRAAPGIREVAEHNLHLTVKFLGEVPPTEAEELDRIVSALTLPQVTLTVAGLGFFKQGGRGISAVWARVTPTPGLKQVHSRLQTALSDAGIVRDRHRFTPHITLGKVGSAPQPSVERLIADHAGVRCGPFELTRLCLFESHLGRHGADYQVIADYPLCLPDRAKTALIPVKKAEQTGEDGFYG